MCPAFPGRHVAASPRPGRGRVALEPRVSVAEAVSSLTIADAFVGACEGPAPPRPALPSRFICSFPDCSASYNKAWKLDAHLCKHTGEVTWQRVCMAEPGAGTASWAWPGAGALQRLSSRTSRFLASNKCAPF